MKSASSYTQKTFRITLAIGVLFITSTALASLTEQKEQERLEQQYPALALKRIMNQLTKGPKQELEGNKTTLAKLAAAPVAAALHVLVDDEKVTELALFFANIPKGLYSIIGERYYMQSEHGESLFGELRRMTHNDLSKIVAYKKVHAVEELQQLKVSVALAIKRQNTKGQYWTQRYDDLPSEDGIQKFFWVIDLNLLDIDNLDGISSPENIPFLAETQQLSLADNLLTSFNGIPDLSCLKHLNLDGNLIANFEGFPCLPNLTRLELSNNLFSSLEVFPHLPKLELLNLGDNKITSLATLINIRELDKKCRISLYNNCIQSISQADVDQLHYLAKREVQLKLKKNQLTQESEEIVRNNSRAEKGWFVLVPRP